MKKMEEQEITLGEKIKLVGFNELETPDLILVKKLLGTQVKKIVERYEDPQEIRIYHKSIHGSGHEISINLTSQNGEKFHVGETHHNLYIALSSAFEALENTLKKEYGKK